MKVASFLNLRRFASVTPDPGNDVYFYPPTASAFRDGKHYVENKVGHITIRFYNPETTFVYGEREWGKEPTYGSILQNYCRTRGLNLFIAQVINPYDTDEVTGEDCGNVWPYDEMAVVITARKRPTFYVNTQCCGPGLHFGRKEPELMLKISSCDGEMSTRTIRGVDCDVSFSYNGAICEVEDMEFTVWNDSFPQKNVDENGHITEYSPTGEYWIVLDRDDYLLKIITALELMLKSPDYFTETYSIASDSIPFVIFPK